jgi:uncharacterized protein YggT (Ycf19 family)
MQAIRVRPPSSVAQFTFQLSDWLVRPLRRIVPGVGGYDWASLIGAFLIVLAGDFGAAAPARRRWWLLMACSAS